MKQVQLPILLFIFLILSGCVEEIDIMTETEFESALVIEATITNELKHQEILLSRAFPLDSVGSSPERNANVKVVDDVQNEFVFQETDPGKYASTSVFSAEPNRSYTLQITTDDGRPYTSQSALLTQNTQIDNLVAERGFNENGIEGVSIFVDSFDPTGNSKFYRYTYEETYKVIAPWYSPNDLIINNDDFPYPPDFLDRFDTGLEIIEFFVIKQLREEQEQICYNTVRSNEIIIENTNLFEEDRIDGLKVRFINRNNYIISHRYSILVKQYVQTSEAHQFYKSLKELSSSESLFSQTQPGFLVGNVFSESDSSEKVLGFFEVSSVSSKRVYFNYKDLFPGEILPPYYINCTYFFSPALITRDMLTGIITESPLQDAIKRGEQFLEENLLDGELVIGAPYEMVLPPCGDCTVLGSNVVPDFWVE
ncbi:MAG: DUF4249 domain-containing protein [Flavobacteriaceae bacterium]|nr:DUF4249 domain-containing protein [Flavobacteriaceae bacterium]